MNELYIKCHVEQSNGAVVEYFVRSDNRDRVAWDMTRARKQWPANPKEAMSLYMTFLTWSALRRSGEADIKLDDFLERCVSVAPVNEDGSPIRDGDTPETEVDPTRPDHVSG